MSFFWIHLTGYLLWFTLAKCYKNYNSNYMYLNAHFTVEQVLNLKKESEQMKRTMSNSISWIQMIHTMHIISTKRKSFMKVIKVSIEFAVEKAAIPLCCGNHLTAVAS